MKSILLLLALAGTTAAQTTYYGGPVGYVNAVTLTATSSSTASAFFGDGSNLTNVTATNDANTITSSFTVTGAGGVKVTGPLAASTVTITLNGAAVNFFPESPLLLLGNANTYLQEVMQNLSNGNNASSDLIMTTDLGGDTSFYLDIGVNSSQFSQTLQTAEASSSTFVTSSDAPLVIWSDTNGALNGGSGHVIIGSSIPVTGNKAMDISSNTVAVTPNSFSVGGSSFTVGGGSATVAYSLTVGSLSTAGTVTVSSAVFVGTFLSTQTAGSAGTAVTALCSRIGTSLGTAFAQGGGCSCAGAVAETANISIPNCVATGCIPTGWTCQVSGGTGGACSAYAICSRAQ